jgi:phage gpG-like protein
VASLAHAISRFETLGRRITTATREIVAVRGIDVIDRGFEGTKDPYGAQWAKRKQAKPWRILNKTGRLQGGWRSETTWFGCRFSNRVPYSEFHQYGTIFMPSRKMVPSLQRGYSRPWAVMVKQAFVEACKAEAKL